eukprot:4794062-Pyramimonas_sp.AAC.1
MLAAMVTMTTARPTRAPMLIAPMARIVSTRRGCRFIPPIPVVWGPRFEETAPRVRPPPPHPP